MVLVAIGCPGCFLFTTKEQGDALRARVVELETRVGTQEHDLAAKVGELDRSIGLASKVLSSNSADLGTQVQGVSDDVARLSGENLELKRQLATLEADQAAANRLEEEKIALLLERLDAVKKAAGVIEVGGPTSQPILFTREGLLADAQRKLDAGQAADARGEFQLWLANSPNDPSSDRALFGVAEGDRRDHQNERAIGEFAQVISAYPQSAVIDDAYFEAGDAALEIKRCTDARAFFSELARLFPSSPFAARARSRIGYIKRNLANAAICGDSGGPG